MGTTWIILSGEYPPKNGGVSDYSQRIAWGLAERGDTVHVVAPAPLDQNSPIGAVIFHPLDGCFDGKSRQTAEAIIRSVPQPRRIFLQYVPHIYGQRAMNVGFARWIDHLARSGETVDVMFHEISFPLVPGQKLKHRFLAHVTRYMAKQIGRGANRAFVSIEQGESRLRELGMRQSVKWLPIFSTISKEPIPRHVEAIRAAFGGTRIVGHFGTYGDAITALLQPLLISIARTDPRAEFLLIGRGSEAFLHKLSADSIFANRVRAVGELPQQSVNDHLAACDVMVQPFEEGVTTRRSSVSASLAIGTPVVTSNGFLSESIWSTSGAVSLAENCSADAMLAAYSAAAESPEKLAALGAAGKQLYSERFDIRRTLEAL